MNANTHFDEQGPYYLVNSVKDKHIGPFTTLTDALLAKNIGDQSNGWNDATIMAREEFKLHLAKI